MFVHNLLYKKTTVQGVTTAGHKNADFLAVCQVYQDLLDHPLVTDYSLPFVILKLSINAKTCKV